MRERMRRWLRAHPKAWAKRIASAETIAEAAALAGRRLVDGQRVWDGHVAGERLGELLDELAGCRLPGAELEGALELVGVLEAGKVPILELAFAELELEALTARERASLEGRGA